MGWGSPIAWFMAGAIIVGFGGSIPQGPQPTDPAAELKASKKGCAKGPLRKPRKNCNPAPPPSTGNPYKDCVARINQLRWECQCLPPLQRWRGGEKCANRLAKYDSKRGIHAGFNDAVCEPRGSAQNECPGWPSTEETIDGCLQAMWDEGPGRRFSKHGHYINMSSRKYTQVACGFHKARKGSVWSVQDFK